MDGEMLRQWAAVEHNRLHCAEEWPDGPHKQAVIAAIHATLESLFENSGTSTRLSECMACAARKKILRPTTCPGIHLPSAQLQSRATAGISSLH
jgi:hypothetical protein